MEFSKKFNPYMKKSWQSIFAPGQGSGYSLERNCAPAHRIITSKPISELTLEIEEIHRLVLLLLFFLTFFAFRHGSSEIPTSWDSLVSADASRCHWILINYCFSSFLHCSQDLQICVHKNDQKFKSKIWLVTTLSTF